MALVFVPQRLERIRVVDLVTTIAEVSGLFALVHGFLIDFSAFDSTWSWLVLESVPVMIAATVILIHFRKGDPASAA
jgi:hypothetical protein